MSNSKPNSLVYIVVDFNSSKMRGSKRPLRFHHINFPRHTTWKRRPSEGSGRLLSKIKVRKKINLECFREPVAQSCSAKMRHGWGHNIFRKSQDKTTLGWLGLLCQSRTVELSRGIGLLGDQSTWSAGAHERESRCQLAVDLLVVISCFWERKKFSPKH